MEAVGGTLPPFVRRHGLELARHQVCPAIFFSVCRHFLARECTITCSSTRHQRERNEKESIERSTTRHLRRIRSTERIYPNITRMSSKIFSDRTRPHRPGFSLSCSRDLNARTSKTYCLSIDGSMRTVSFRPEQRQRGLGGSRTNPHEFGRRMNNRLRSARAKGTLYAEVHFPCLLHSPVFSPALSLS